MGNSQPWPFWRVAFSIAAGLLIAGAVAWTAVELRARYELAEATKALDREIERMEREAQQRARFAAERRKQAQREAQSKRRERVEVVPYYPPALPGMKPGEVACMNGYMVQRLADGWDELTDRHHNRRGCRVR